MATLSDAVRAGDIKAHLAELLWNTGLFAEIGLRQLEVADYDGFAHSVRRLATYNGVILAKGADLLEAYPPLPSARIERQWTTTEEGQP